jgi:hypothetical protein
MTNPDDATTPPIFTSLKREFQDKFKKQIRVMCSGLNEIESPPIKHTIDQCLLIMERNVQSLIYEVISSLPDEAGFETNFATFNLFISGYLTDIEHDLVNTVSLATKMPSLLAVDNPRLYEIRRRIERQIDSYQSIFGLTQVDKSGAKKSKKRRGPKDKYDWFEATHHVWIRIHRGTLIAETRQDVIEAFQNFFKGRNEKPPSEPTIDPFVSPIWAEVNPKNRNDN